MIRRVSVSSGERKPVERRSGCRGGFVGRWLGVFVVVVCLKITIDLLVVVAPKGGAIANFSKTVFAYDSFS